MGDDFTRLGAQRPTTLAKQTGKFHEPVLLGLAGELGVLAGKITVVHRLHFATGMFFDVTAPSFETSALVWSLRTLDQNDLGVDSALRTLQDRVKGDPASEQALPRLEIQVGPATVARVANPAVAGARNAVGTVAATSIDPPPAPASAASAADDPILANPNEAYRSEVIAALKDAMLDHSSGLNIA